MQINVTKFLPVLGMKYANKKTHERLNKLIIDWIKNDEIKTASNLVTCRF